MVIPHHTGSDVVYAFYVECDVFEKKMVFLEKDDFCTQINETFYQVVLRLYNAELNALLVKKNKRRTLNFLESQHYLTLENNAWQFFNNFKVRYTFLLN